ncbi:hypothetical protein O163_07090 [Caldanaerobacter subterraneus subsp. yonseiensis KB-1]|uniref:Uncharacterized protein n=1 Tax=Caldanaerobacter subterraneus subsp. yonseiensis KB-1 TaxID=1388761 RepID=U5CVM7_CALSX|nr:hypothetical protein [Caldanaerobacter subterraneus]ERM92127.1 hypothetical protein O163_07090 [Caldanaerobacter subterraneus subsp. yonseiensis KB-1]
MVVLTINWWLDFSKDILTITQGQGHAGKDETSLGSLSKRLLRLVLFLKFFYL